MTQRFYHLRLFGILLGVLVCLYGCDRKAHDGSTKSQTYAIEKTYYKGPLRVTVRVSDEQVTLSGLLTLELSTESTSEYETQFPDITVLKQFRVLSCYDQSEVLSEGGMAVKTIQYQLEPLELGRCEIPVLTFDFKSKDTLEQDSVSGILTTEPVWIDVTTSLATDPNAFMIADIEEIVEVKASYLWLWISFAVICLLAVGIGVGLLIKPQKATEIRRIYKSAHEIAFAALKAIGAENLVEQGRVKEFYEKLSTCLRQYIENRFQLRAPEQTTEEFLEQIKTSDALKLEHKQQLQKFLEHCDLVKFARYQPTHEQINESLTIAEEFVEKTKSEEHLVDVTEPKPAKGEVVS